MATLALAGCAKSSSFAPCVPMEQSTPNDEDDPCVQDDCQGVPNLAECNQDGTWGACYCLGDAKPTPGTGGTGGGSPGACNNGTVDMGEMCDGSNFNGATCGSLGMGSGALMCDPVTCDFDTSMCGMMPPPMGGAGG